MDDAQPKRRLKAFLKHATIRISSAKDHGFANDSASAHSIDDDGRSQRSSNSAKKDSKLRRIGRGIREWRSKRRRLHEDTRPNALHTLQGKSFSSSEASLPEEPFENEDSTDEDEPVDRPENHALKSSEGVQGETLEDKLPWEMVHEKVAVRQGAGEYVAPREIQSQARSRKEATVLQTSITISSPPTYNSLVWPHLTPHDEGLKSSGVVIRAILMIFQRAAQEKNPGTPMEGTVYICSDGDFSLAWIGKALALATVIRYAAKEAFALEADVDDLKYPIRLSDELDRSQLLRFSDDTCPEKIMTASIGMRMREQYYELRRLGAWVESHWLPIHSGLPGNEVADRMAALSFWWLKKVAPRSAQGTGLVVPSKVLTFDEPWTRYCPHQGQTQYNENTALQLLEDTKGLLVVLSTRTLGSASYSVAVGPVGARAGPDVLALRPASQSAGRLLHPASVGPSAEIGEATLNLPSSSITTGSPPSHNIAFEPRHQVVPEPQPPPPSPQPQLKVRTKKQRKKRPAASENLLCIHCWAKDHLIQQCFERFPEQKIASPQRYARYAGRHRLEKVMPGAFNNLARLHPQLVPQPFHGQDSRYMVGRVGISPHQTPRQCAVWAIRYQAAQPGRDVTAAQSIQDRRQHLREKYRWDEAQGAELD